MVSMQDWLIFLKGSHGIIGFPLVIVGLGMMLLGWRLWKICVMLSFAGMFAALGAWLVGPADNQWLYALLLGAVGGLLSYWPVNLAVALLGGCVGAGIISISLSNMGLSGTSLWVSGGVSLVAFTAYSIINRVRVVIVMTSFLGAVMLMSGLTAWVMSMPAFYGTLRSMVNSSVLVLPFLILVPTVVSSFYQMAEARRVHTEM